MRNDKVRKIALTALLLSLALIFSYIESLISLGFVFPGFRLGLSNITVLVVLYVFGEKYAVPFGLFKSFFSLLFLGRLSSLLFSVCGTAMSLIIMILLGTVFCGGSRLFFLFTSGNASVSVAFCRIFGTCGCCRCFSRYQPALDKIR